MSKHRSIVLEGPMHVITQEGGYAWPGIAIGGRIFEADVEEMLGKPLPDYVHGPEESGGRWMLILVECD